MSETNTQPKECERKWIPDEAHQMRGYWSPECPNIKETYSDMSGERYRCEKCGYSYYLDYDDMK
jgi:hypothetical protein